MFTLGLRNEVEVTQKIFKINSLNAHPICVDKNLWSLTSRSQNYSLNTLSIIKTDTHWRLISDDQSVKSANEKIMLGEFWRREKKET